MKDDRLDTNIARMSQARARASSRSTAGSCRNRRRSLHTADSTLRTAYTSRGRMESPSGARSREVALARSRSAAAFGKDSPRRRNFQNEADERQCSPEEPAHNDRGPSASRSEQVPSSAGTPAHMGGRPTLRLRRVRQSGL